MLYHKDVYNKTVIPGLGVLAEIRNPVAKAYWISMVPDNWDLSQIDQAHLWLIQNHLYN